MYKVMIIAIAVVSITYTWFFNQSLIELTEDYRCPYCFGNNFCDVLYKSKITYKKTSLKDIFNNYLSVKKVFTTENNMVFKKLGYYEDFNRVDKLVCVNNNLDEHCNFEEIMDRNDYRHLSLEYASMNIDGSVKDFKICGAVNKFFMYIKKLRKLNVSLDSFYKNLWFILNISAQPLILQILNAKDGWPVPMYLGACGRLIVEEYAGDTLNDFQYHSWYKRAYLALQLLQVADQFTNKHPEFRFYLTDISPDNIAVDSDLKPRIVDLENLIVTEKDNNKSYHHSNVFETNQVAYSENEICNSSISDHNYFSVCMLLLWDNAPWPMMKGGLLHTVPTNIYSQYPRLFTLINDCVKPTSGRSRINSTFEIMDILKDILDNIS